MQDGKNVRPKIPSQLVEIKKRGNLSITSLAMLQCTNTTKSQVFSSMPKNSDVSVVSQIERSISVFFRSEYLISPLGVGPFLSVGPVQPKFAVTFLTNWLTALLLFSSVGKLEKD